MDKIRVFATLTRFPWESVNRLKGADVNPTHDYGTEHCENEYDGVKSHESRTCLNCPRTREARKPAGASKNRLDPR